MRTTILAILVLALVGTRALAQPSATVPAPYAYQPQLTVDDQELLLSGEITDDQRALGGVAALFVGFGVGQAVEGRWHETGWIFTLGESASTLALVWGLGIGLSDCFGADGSDKACNSNRGVPLIVGGLIGLTGFRIGELIDAVVMPPHHNAEVRALRARLGYPTYSHLTPYVVPMQGGGSVAGLSLRF